MIGYVEAPRAWGHTNGMARALGYSLRDALLDGWLSRREVADLVTACSSCNRTPECKTWLASPRICAETPAFCTNATALGALKP